MENEIGQLEHWQWITWDLQNDCEFRHAVTGTPDHPLPPLTQRYVQRANKRVHVPDGGELVTRWSTRWEGSKSFTTLWQECQECGKHFYEQEL